MACQPACTGARTSSKFAPVLYQSLRLGTVPRLWTRDFAFAGSYGYGSVEMLLPGMPTGTMPLGMSGTPSSTVSMTALRSTEYDRA